VLRDHRLSVAIVLAAFVCTAGVFLFARPEYKPLQGEEIRGDKFKAPIEGWTWADGVPGFQFGRDEEHWNFSLLRPNELADARAAASRFGVDSASVRPLVAQRLGMNELSVILAGRNASGRTCLGFVLPRKPVAYTCPRDQAGFVVVAARPEFGTGLGRGFPFFLTGVSRGDVERVVVTAPSVWQVVHRNGSVTYKPRRVETVYHRGDGWWGTFTLSLSNSYRRAIPNKPWRARVDFYGAGGLLASQSFAYAGPTNRAVAVSP
jgi:hypothetical protein